MKLKNKSEKFMSSVKVGSKGQIVIPKEVREMFNISPGDTLLLLADSKKGIAITENAVFEKFADNILSGKAKEIYTEQDEDGSMEAEKAINQVKEKE